MQACASISCLSHAGLCGNPRTNAVVPDRLPMAKLRLDHVQIAAPPGSEEAARRFYGELLGLPEIPKPAELLSRGGVWFQVGQHQLHVGIEEPFVPARKAHPAFAVENLDELASELVSAGVAVNWDQTVPGMRRFYVNDPFGNRLEFLAD